MAALALSTCPPLLPSHSTFGLFFLPLLGRQRQSLDDPMPSSLFSRVCHYSAVYSSLPPMAAGLGSGTCSRSCTTMSRPVTSSTVICSKSRRVSIEFLICAYLFGIHRRNFSMGRSSIKSVSPFCAICSIRLVSRTTKSSTCSPVRKARASHSPRSRCSVARRMLSPPMRAAAIASHASFVMVLLGMEVLSSMGTEAHKASKTRRSSS